MKLNLGCGFNKLPGYVNVDSQALCRPDVVHDLEKFPWPWEDNSVSEIFAFHSLEHLGRGTDIWLGIMREIWRVCKPDALLNIVVPHPRHDNFIHDPTHVRTITPVGMAMFDQARNLADLAEGGAETKLGLLNSVDIEVIQVGYRVAPAWQARLDSGELAQADLEKEMMERNNVCTDVGILCRIVKPMRGEDWMRNYLSTGEAATTSPP